MDAALIAARPSVSGERPGARLAAKPAIPNDLSVPEADARQRLVPELLCTSIERSLAFYCHVLRFEVLFERPEDGFAYLRREGAELMLEDVNRAQRVWLTGELDRPFGRGINFQIETADVDALHARVVAAEVPRFLELEERWYRVGDEAAGNRQFVVQDPDGYLLRFFEDIGRRPA